MKINKTSGLFKSVSGACYFHSSGKLQKSSSTSRTLLACTWVKRSITCKNYPDDGRRTNFRNVAIWLNTDSPFTSHTVTQWHFLVKRKDSGISSNKRQELLRFASAEVSTLVRFVQTRNSVTALTWAVKNSNCLLSSVASMSRLASCCEVQYVST